MRALLDGQGLQDDPTPQPSPVLLNLTPPAQPGSVQYMVARVLQEQQAGDLILITTIAPQWPAEMERLLREGFALSISEIEICELIADGLNPAAIAEARRSALATVRTQIKKVMAKTHCGSQAELVRLLHSVMRVADQEAENAKQRPITPERETLFALADRTMPLREFGDPSGYPIVYFHGMLDGIPIRKSFEAELIRHNLRLICPVRPYFGFATGAKGTPRSAPERFGQDVAKMITDMDLKQPILVGYMAGAIYAHGVAAALPNGALRGMLNVSAAVPILSNKQFANMSRRQRLVAYTARFTPSILPFVIRAGISQMDRGGATTFMESLYENRPFDMAVASDPDVRDTILEGYRFTVQQGHKAFEIDSHVIVNDWSALVDASTVPVRLLHGEHDPACDVAAVREFAQRYGHRTSIEVLPETGQLILYKYPEKVIAELCAIRDHGVVLN
jgi:pimeloyl-ACP methyl ester carboxylesterase/DNA-binding CsgD family transcriptional regulator